MRFSLAVVSVVLAALAIACDASSEQPEGAPIVSVEPMDLSECRAASVDGHAALASLSNGASACEVDSDCTIAVADTRCTGEVAVAVSVGDEERFLLLTDKLDARLCADLRADCGSPSESEPESLNAVCDAGRCTIE